ncbi:2-hydroxychromene-2-carboxylate isomerase [Leptospira interrogans]
MARIDFWYDPASSYSFLSALRIEALAKDAGVEVAWRPFLLGPIFKEQGWTTSPFNLYPAKGRYMVRDIERVAASRGLGFRLPAIFPANSLKAARIALVGAEEGWIAPFTRAMFAAQFEQGADIDDDQVLRRILDDLKLDAAVILSRTETPQLKQKLKDQTAEAARLGIFGAPTFTVKGEIFWGDDRLEQALDWAIREDQYSPAP